MRKFLMVLFVTMMIPYITTLGWTGRLENTEMDTESSYVGARVQGEENTKNSETNHEDSENQGNQNKIFVIRGDEETIISVEEFLIHVLAAQIPADFGPETLKAQAILARTYIYRLMDGADTIHEEELDMDALSREQMEKRWGTDHFAKNYQKLKTAVDTTSGMYLTHNGTYIEPLFCFASAGMTRSRGEVYPYLKQAESAGDLLAEEYLHLYSFTNRQLANLVSSIPDASPVSAVQIPGEIQIVKRDGAGYVEQIQIGKKTYTGEEVQYALGLPSSCYFFKESDGKIEVVCKGVGHGYGFSQNGANELEKTGMDCQDLLMYYFQNVEIHV